MGVNVLFRAESTSAPWYLIFYDFEPVFLKWDHFSKNKNQILEFKYRDVKDGANRRFLYTDPGKKISQSEFSIAGKDIYTCTEKFELGKQPD